MKQNPRGSRATKVRSHEPQRALSRVLGDAWGRSLGGSLLSPLQWDGAETGEGKSKKNARVAITSV